MGRYQDDGTWIWTAIDPISKAVLGKDIAAGEITTSFVERCNLTMRQDNKRLAWKTLAFFYSMRELLTFPYHDTSPFNYVSTKTTEL